MRTNASKRKAKEIINLKIKDQDEILAISAKQIINAASITREDFRKLYFEKNNDRNKNDFNNMLLTLKINGRNTGMPLFTSILQTFGLTESFLLSLNKFMHSTAKPLKEINKTYNKLEIEQ